MRTLRERSWKTSSKVHYSPTSKSREESDARYATLLRTARTSSNELRTVPTTSCSLVVHWPPRRRSSESSVSCATSWRRTRESGFAPRGQPFSSFDLREARHEETDGRRCAPRLYSRFDGERRVTPR